MYIDTPIVTFVKPPPHNNNNNNKLQIPIIHTYDDPFLKTINFHAEEYPKTDDILQIYTQHVTPYIVIIIGLFYFVCYLQFLEFL